ncbi:hypothetical protein MASR1M12_01280 [Erysipelotrichia bacterium]
MNEKPSQVNVRTINREDFPSVYSNNHIITFNPYEFTIEFNMVDGLVASDRINSSSGEIPAKTVAKVVLSHRAMEEFVSTVNKVFEDYKKMRG